jgi:hypothetical protein
MKDLLVNTWNRLVNKFALPHGESEELPGKIQKIPSLSPDKMVLPWSSRDLSEEVLSDCLESNLHQYQ